MVIVPTFPPITGYHVLRQFRPHPLWLCINAYNLIREITNTVYVSSPGPGMQTTLTDDVFLLLQQMESTRVYHCSCVKKKKLVP